MPDEASEASSDGGIFCGEGGWLKAVDGDYMAALEVDGERLGVTLDDQEGAGVRRVERGMVNVHSDEDMRGLMQCGEGLR